MMGMLSYEWTGKPNCGEVKGSGSCTDESMPHWKRSSSIAIREGIDDNEVMNEAIEEHHVVRVLIAELKKLESSDETFKAKFSCELVKHHVKEEEGEMLPQAEKI